MSWTSENITALIEGVQQHPNLYAVKSIDYHNKHKRSLSLNQIAAMINRANTTPADVQKKWNGLRSTYATERRKLSESMKSGCGSDDVSNFYFKN